MMSKEANERLKRDTQHVPPPKAERGGKNTSYPSFIFFLQWLCTVIFFEETVHGDGHGREWLTGA